MNQKWRRTQQKVKRKKSWMTNFLIQKTTRLCRNTKLQSFSWKDLSTLRRHLAWIPWRKKRRACWWRLGPIKLWRSLRAANTSTDCSTIWTKSTDLNSMWWSWMSSPNCSRSRVMGDWISKLQSIPYEIFVFWNMGLFPNWSHFLM